MLHIDHSWTLFLDRDGVINKNIDGSYVLDWEQFEFLDGVLETMPKLAKLFNKIIVVYQPAMYCKRLADRRNTQRNSSEYDEHD
jgi:hypothetical protein